jgi:hypothetical protein
MKSLMPLIGRARALSRLTATSTASAPTADQT